MPYGYGEKRDVVTVVPGAIVGVVQLAITAFGGEAAFRNPGIAKSAPVRRG